MGAPPSPGEQPHPPESAAELRARLEVLQEDYEALLVAGERARARIEELTRWAAWHEDRLAHITGSASWRLTAPLRAVKDSLRGLRRGGGA
ncbi:MAG: hypothetical protein ACRDKX_02515 [Solirubrobacterales bacterium]